MGNCTVILVLSLTCLVDLKLMTAHKKAVRNTELDNIYKTENQLYDGNQPSIICCMASCLRNKYCKSFAYNLNTERCQSFSRKYRGQVVSEDVFQEGIMHFDLADADCAEVQNQGYNSSGVYTIVVGGVTKQVWCDLQTDGGRWTVIQRRKDGSVDFDVGWNEYKDGFGVPSQEYWIGNDALFALTSSGTVELLVLMERWNGAWFHARYSSFRVNDESDKYRLAISGFSGSAGDSLFYHSGHQFSTLDQDNDAWSNGACNPDTRSGGWLFNSCARSVLNGQYHDTPIVSRFSFYCFHITNQRESLKTVFMMIREN